MRGCLSSPGSQKKGGPGDRLGGSAQEDCHCPLLPWLPVSWGPLESRTRTSVGRRGRRANLGRAPQRGRRRRALSGGSLSLSLSLTGESQGTVSVECASAFQGRSQGRGQGP